MKGQTYKWTDNTFTVCLSASLAQNGVLQITPTITEVAFNIFGSENMLFLAALFALDTSLMIKKNNFLSLEQNCIVFIKHVLFCNINGFQYLH